MRTSDYVVTAGKSKIRGNQEEYFMLLKLGGLDFNIKRKE
jgi:hypothetical protein